MLLDHPVTPEPSGVSPLAPDSGGWNFFPAPRVAFTHLVSSVRYAREGDPT
jgi:hypothetical protein